MIEQYHAVGLSALPAITAQRRPAIGGWKDYQSHIPTSDDIGAWPKSTGSDGVCIICGSVSGNLEMIDFDVEARAYESWRSSVSPELMSRLVVESSQSGGKHVVYRCASPVEGNMKLASTFTEANHGDEVKVCGKTYRARRLGDRQGVVLTLIETRGEGGLFLCDPSPGYVVEQGSLLDVPTISEQERQQLLDAARMLNEYEPEPVSPRSPRGGDTWGIQPSGKSPADDYNERGPVRDLLLAHGWRLFRSGESDHLTRPGKKGGVSASLRNGALFVFSSNAPPFDANASYSPFAVYTLLEHGGDYPAASGALRKSGWGEDAPLAGVSLDGILAQESSAPSPESAGQSDSAGVEPEVAEGMEVDAWDVFEALPLDQIQRTEPSPAVIHGLLRQEETMNLVAQSKIGKTWLAIGLSISVATGLDWLGHEVEQGRVLHIDNELRRHTLTYRYDKVAEEMGVPLDLFAHNITTISLRGRLANIDTLASLFMSSRYPRGHFSLVIIDALYRCLPEGVDENDNGAIAKVYNKMDVYSESMGAAIVLIHHTSKGNQNGKEVTDVGAGAGAQSRAADTHSVLRRSEDRSAILFDAEPRSWPPFQTQALKFQWPLFHELPNVDVSALVEGKPESEKPLKVEEFVDAMIVGNESYEMVVYSAKQAGVSEKETKRLLAVAQEIGIIDRVKGHGGKMVYRKNQ